MADIVRFNKKQLQGDTVIWDQSGYDQGYYSIDTDDGVQPWEGNSSSTSLSVFPPGYAASSDFAVNQAVIYQEMSCYGAHNYYNDNLFDFESAVILSYYNVNLIPSDYQLFDCLPKHIQILTDDYLNGTTQHLTSDCDADYDINVRLNGISSQQCYGDIGSFEDEGPFEEMCRQNCSIKYGQGLRIIDIANNSGISESLIRNLISRFGPVWVYNSDQTRFQVC
ncbi:MAG: hypothetical protein EZS28_037920 [Streblomastix strix]|uniref:Uncharacterized protein n=1 Tax=Streblomastix strix TaxID=222440 RepID=A0A5J4U8L5_9EUKA|nr:MAG: hypothetical protein EZS28_037920 [Streblomastix strix]